MPFFPKDYQQMITDSLQRLRLESNITQLSPGSKARFLLETFTREQSSQHSFFDQNLMQSFVRWAEGRFLDFFGDVMHTPRWESTTATVDADHFNFLFYVDSGTFGDINNGLDITIPAGTSVSTVEFNVQRTNEGTALAVSTPRTTKIAYSTTQPVVCKADRSYAWVPIRAVIEGKSSDVARNALRKHSFTAYTLANRDLLKCRNKYSITNGRDRESDESYRYRLMNSFKARERANKIAIRLAALSVPGVADVTEINVEQGPGTYSLYVEGISPTVSPGMIKAVSDAVEKVTAFGVRPFVLAPSLLGVEFVIGIKWIANVTESNKILVQARIREEIESSLNNMGIGESLTLSELITLLTMTDKSIAGIGFLKPNTFEEVYLHRSSPDGLSTSKISFSGDVIEPFYNERIMLETSTRFRGVQFL